jgi:hypothetical protein
VGPTVQLDDYPYVHLQILADRALTALGHDQAYHHFNDEAQGNGPFKDPRELGGLIHLLNEDYAQLLRGQFMEPLQPGLHLLERFDRASELAGAPPKFRSMSDDVRRQIGQAIDDEARRLLTEQKASFPSSLEGRTVVIEFARGGPPGDSMPLPEHFGYAGSLPHLSPEILSRAAILYIAVTPEESRRKNRARARPDGDGSILFHGTPEVVMEAEYSRCDMTYLAETSPVAGAVRVVRGGTNFDIPVAIFDNRDDLTTFVRDDESQWPADQVAALTDGLHAACDHLWQTCCTWRG